MHLLLSFSAHLTHASFDSSSHAKAGSNPFVSLALLYTIRLASELSSTERVQQIFSQCGLTIFVLGDNDFYSQRAALGDSVTLEALASLAPFAKQNCRIGDVHKTGLGSSAAMTTSLVGSVLIHIHEDVELGLIHNLAQLAHCAAQGKVGSGFDVSAAVWGSQLYRRFDPAVLQECLDEGARVPVEGETAPPATGAKKLLPILDPKNPLWQPSPLDSSESGHPTATEGLALGAGAGRPAPLQLPPRINLVLADVDAGSHTPSLVSKVLAWRREKPEWAAQLYAVLASSNQTLSDALLTLRLMAAQDPIVYDDALEAASALPSSKWTELVPTQTPSSEEEDGKLVTTKESVVQTLVLVRNTLRAIRAGMRELGVRAGVPVEPDEMGRLIHRACESVPALLGGGVPGAGGYDALYLLYIAPRDNPDRPRKDVEQFCLAHANDANQGVQLNVAPLLSRADGADKPLDSTPKSDPLAAIQDEEPTQGLRREDPPFVRGLINAVNAAS